MLPSYNIGGWVSSTSFGVGRQEACPPWRESTADKAGPTVFGVAADANDAVRKVFDN